MVIGIRCFTIAGVAITAAAFAAAVAAIGYLAAVEYDLHRAEA